MERHARISSVGSALPSRVVPNAYFESLVETSDEWIVDRTGIRERRFAGPGERAAPSVICYQPPSMRSGWILEPSTC